MKARGAAVQGGLAVAALVAAYFTWQRGPEESRGDVVVLDVAKSSLERIRYQTDTRWIELVRKSEASGPAVWVKSGPLDPAPNAAPPAPALDGGSADGGSGALAAAAPPRPPEKPKELRGNERAERVYERFAPLKAARALGALSAEKLKELSLEGSTRRLEVFTTGGRRSFKVSASQFGMSPYAQDEADGKVYLLSSALLSELEPSSQQLVDRRLHAFKPSEFDAFVVKAGDKQREFVHTGGDLPQAAQVAPKESPDKPDELVRNWHDKVWSRLLVTELLGAGETPASGEPQLALRIDYLFRGRPKGWLEVATGKDKEVWARSEQTAGWVLLHGSAEEVLAEAKKVAGGG